MIIINDRFSFLKDIHFIEYLYEKYKIDPNSIELSWNYFFHGFDFGRENHINNNIRLNKKSTKIDLFKIIKKEIYVLNLIQYYKDCGHYFTNTNPIPISNKKKEYKNYLEINKFGLSKNDFEKSFESGKSINIGNTSLKNIINHLKNVYCNSIGIEYSHILNPNKICWIEKNFLKNRSIFFSKNEKKFFLKKLNESTKFENFIHNKFIGQKRFSIEGNDSIIILLEEMIKYSCKNYSTKEFILGMSHRGRLNIISNFLNKDLSKIFIEFQNKEYEDNSFSGDVKYHMGYSSIKSIDEINKNVNIYLLPNPSHLESVTPVVEGMTRAKIDKIYNKNNYSIIPILIHGDAALSGQGIIYEVLQLSKLKGYKTGGTIHIVINNQIGFTTNDVEGRSSFYCTDIAKTISSPILHVNADDIESVAKSIRFAIDFRMSYQEDIFIDLIGYRRHGHNEGDDPRFTQPILYKKIFSHPNSYELYKIKLKNENIINNDYIKNIEEKYDRILNKKYEESKKIKKNYIIPFLYKEWKNIPIVIKDEDIFNKIDTKISLKTILNISKKIFSISKEKIFFKKIKSIFLNRLKMLDNHIVDWSMAEILAYATLLYEGYCIRLSGEDVARGTFSQRHIVIKTEDEEEIIILNKELNSIQGKIEIYNSPLSEYGVLGFDYGYAMATPNTLTVWEAQFGDFSNGCQIIIDQYISSGEDKWKVQNGIVLLLPHGYEGQGPEHSSARIERYLQLCAKNNLFVVNCTYPSNFYHLLRRQMKLKFRKPLIIFTPKSLLRHTKCLSSIEELSNGSFEEIVDDNLVLDYKKIKRVILCSGKIYYDLLNKKESIKDDKIALVRIEQIYPLNINKIKNILDKYKNKKDIFWVQEEPENMGLWSFILRKISSIIKIKLISPSENSSPSVGSYISFLKIRNKVLEKSFIF
ncbi:2-oxoglutarate dehydrogenase E1 component [Blattabacterium cuenoti]|uniref:2-oxoglutarate dehydrogenase E1 component n=1 Tax=Blattabacterium cuenoti TaxID=1653831 RepID=UPI001EE9E8B0|nr:2-oxoglutarate dehydrogenase E1 component [Blattabacterium cuenoti]